MICSSARPTIFHQPGFVGCGTTRSVVAYASRSPIFVFAFGSGRSELDWYRPGQLTARGYYQLAGYAPGPRLRTGRRRRPGKRTRRWVVLASTPSPGQGSLSFPSRESISTMIKEAIEASYVPRPKELIIPTSVLIPKASETGQNLRGERTETHHPYSEKSATPLLASESPTSSLSAAPPNI